MERTKFMQSIMNATHAMSMTEAVFRGFDGSWERAIAASLKIEVRTGNSEAEVILQAAGGDYLKAAYLITSSKIPENA
jgi:hypothetical protein